MAHFWLRRQPNRSNQEEPARSEWAIARLPDDGAAFVITDDPQQPVRVAGKARNGSEVARILRVGDRQRETWVLQSSQSENIHVNGFPLIAGIRVLKEFDELRTKDTGRMYFSLERRSKVEPFTGKDEGTACARCKAEIARGEPSVQCPQCKTWYHEATDMPCWTYAEKCILCDQPTRLDTGFRWNPDSL